MLIATCIKTKCRVHLIAQYRIPSALSVACTRKERRRKDQGRSLCLTVKAAVVGPTIQESPKINAQKYCSVGVFRATEMKTTNVCARRDSNHVSKAWEASIIPLDHGCAGDVPAPTEAKRSMTLQILVIRRKNPCLLMLDQAGMLPRQHVAVLSARQQ